MHCEVHSADSGNMLAPTVCCIQAQLRPRVCIMTEPLQTRSGKHDISEEQRELNKQVREQITSIPDAKKINEEDLVYRFLIANKWDVPNTVQALKNYTDWRTSANIDNVTEETFPQEICETAMCGFHGVDKQGNPVCVCP